MMTSSWSHIFGTIVSPKPAFTTPRRIVSVHIEGFRFSWALNTLPLNGKENGSANLRSNIAQAQHNKCGEIIRLSKGVIARRINARTANLMVAAQCAQNKSALLLTLFL